MARPARHKDASSGRQAALAGTGTCHEDTAHHSEHWRTREAAPLSKKPWVCGTRAADSAVCEQDGRQVVATKQRTPLRRTSRQPARGSFVRTTSNSAVRSLSTSSGGPGKTKVNVRTRPSVTQSIALQATTSTSGGAGSFLLDQNGIYTGLEVLGEEKQLATGSTPPTSRRRREI